MPYIVALRPTETIDIQVDDTDSLDELFAAVAGRIPDGFELTDIQITQHKVVARRVGYDEVTIESRDELETCAWEGWQALNVREA
ncbi:MAG: hypothetical protein ACTIA6_18900 [Pseudoclavibacter sp.]